VSGPPPALTGHLPQQVGEEKGTIQATWKKSAIGYRPETRATIVSLGFRRLNQTRELPDTPAVRGMLKKVSFLVAVAGEPWKPPRRSRYKLPRTRSDKKHSRGR
jgi:large subunit ribosomal protein L30